MNLKRILVALAALASVGGAQAMHPNPAVAAAIWARSLPGPYAEYGYRNQDSKATMTPQRMLIGTMAAQRGGSQ